MKIKARSKAAKRRAGRPRKEGIVRTPSGQPSRAKDANLEHKLALEAATWRRRRLDPSLSVEDALKPEHGSVIHRWKAISDKRLKKAPDDPYEYQITDEQFSAAEDIHVAYCGYRAAIMSRDPRSSSDYNGPGGFDGTDPFDADRANRDKRSIEHWKATRYAILNAGPLCMMAVEAIIFENKPAQSMMGDLRLALNAVIRMRGKRAA